MLMDSSIGCLFSATTIVITIFFSGSSEDTSCSFILFIIFFLNFIFLFCWCGGGRKWAGHVVTAALCKIIFAVG